jgi:hypothetical protein
VGSGGGVHTGTTCPNLQLKLDEKSSGREKRKKQKGNKFGK